MAVARLVSGSAREEDKKRRSLIRRSTCVADLALPDRVAHDPRINATVAVRALLVAVCVLASCGGGTDNGPSLLASSDEAGVLRVKGDSWRRCAPVKVTLPAPWRTTHDIRVTTAGGFELAYPIPVVRPYEGMVSAAQRACDGGAPIVVEAMIDVRDRRLSCLKTLPLRLGRASA
jgi:hypothetical protein